MLQLKSYKNLLTDRPHYFPSRAWYATFRPNAREIYRVMASAELKSYLPRCVDWDEAGADGEQ